VIVAKKFIFIHFPKTGGKFIEAAIMDYAPVSWDAKLAGDIKSDPHLSALDVPKKYDHLPKFSIVRNPFDWYVSWFHYHREKMADQDFLKASRHGHWHFERAVPNYIAEFGGYSALCRRKFGSNLDAVLLGRFENLRNDTLELLSRFVNVPDALRDKLLRGDKVNTSTHDRYKSYYSSELRSYIEEMDEQALSCFGYSW
jgi:hypothetical protein